MKYSQTQWTLSKFRFYSFPLMNLHAISIQTNLAIVECRLKQILFSWLMILTQYSASAIIVVPSNPSFGPSTKIGISFFLLSAYTNELLSTRKITTFLPHSPLVNKNWIKSSTTYYNSFSSFKQLPSDSIASFELSNHFNFGARLLSAAAKESLIISCDNPLGFHAMIVSISLVAL